MEPDLIGQEKLWITVTLWGEESPAMEPDLIGQEKGQAKADHARRPNGPQWSLTSSVRKRQAGLGAAGQEAGPAMEPDLIGQEKARPRRTMPAAPRARNGA